jgi:hypothetical protein
MNKVITPFFLFTIICLPICLLAQISKERLLPNHQSLLNQQSPYFFVENTGQIINQNQESNKSVLYHLVLPGLNVSLKKTGFSYDAWMSEEIGQEDELMSHKIENSLKTRKRKYVFHRIDVDFLDMNPNCEIQAREKSADYSLYYTPGSTEEGGKTHQYKVVYYKSLYQGIDLEFIAASGTTKPLEYNFIVHPGADVSKIKMRYTGALAAAINGGVLTMKLAHTTLSENIPASWIKETNEDVLVRYEQVNLDEKSITIGFKANIFKNLNTLIIDPTPKLDWGTYYGGANDDVGLAVATDDNGNVFIAGYSNSAQNIASSGAHQTTYSGGNRDGFIAKFNSSGVRQWGTYYGGEYVIDIATDASGNIYLTGVCWGDTAGIATKGSHQTTYGGGVSDAYVAKFNSAGVRQWATYLGGEDSEVGPEITLDVLGNLYVYGRTKSITGIATPGSHQPTAPMGPFGFLVKFNSNGVRQWGTYYGNDGFVYEGDVAVDPSGNVYITGYAGKGSGSGAAIATSGAHQTTHNGGGYDGFVAKFNANGVRQWGTYYGGSGNDVCQDMAIDAAGNVFITGYTTSTSDIATSGAHQKTLSTTQGFGSDAFVVKFNSSGVRQWGTYYGGIGSDYGNGIAVDNLGNVLIVGSTESTTDISSSGAYQTNFRGNQDAFVVKFNTSGTREWGTYYGGTDYDLGRDIVVDRTGYVYFVGSTLSLGDVATSGSHQNSFAGFGSSNRGDAFLARFTTCTKPTITNQPDSQTVILNSTANFVIRLSNPNAKYQWQTDIGSGFQNLNNAGQYSGVDSNTLIVSKVTKNNMHQPFRCIVSSLYCADTSRIALLMVDTCTKPTITNQPDSQTVVLNDTAKFVIRLSNPNAKYQWQTDFGSGFQNLNNAGQYSGVDSNTLIVSKVTMSNNSQQFRCIVSTSYCADTSRAASLNVVNSARKNIVTSYDTISISPNPTDNRIEIKTAASFIGAVYSVYDNLGRVILTGKIHSVNTFIDFNGLYSGVYLIRIGEKTSLSFKVIKE